MKEFRRKQKNRSALYSIPTLVILLLVTILVAKGAVGVMSKAEQSSKLSKSLAEKATTLTLREGELKDSLARLKTVEGVKDEIRKRFSVTQAGEQVAIIIEGRGVSSSTSDSTLPWYKRIWTAIMGKQ